MNTTFQQASSAVALFSSNEVRNLTTTSTFHIPPWWEEVCPAGTPCSNLTVCFRKLCWFHFALPTLTIWYHTTYSLKYSHVRFFLSSVQNVLMDARTLIQKQQRLWGAIMQWSRLILYPMTRSDSHDPCSQQNAIKHWAVVAGNGMAHYLDYHNLRWRMPQKNLAVTDYQYYSDFNSSPWANVFGHLISALVFSNQNLNNRKSQHFTILWLHSKWEAVSEAMFKSVRPTTYTRMQRVAPAVMVRQPSSNMYEPFFIEEK